MSKIYFTNHYKYLKIAFRFLNIIILACFLCLLPSKQTFAKQALTTVANNNNILYAPSDTNQSSIEKMEENETLLAEMKKDQKELNQTYKEKVTAYKNSSSTLTEEQTKELQNLNNSIREKNKRLKKNLSKLCNAKKRYETLNPTSAKARKERKNIIFLQKDSIKRMKKINQLFTREIAILDSVS